MIRRIKESIVTFITGAGVIERTLHGLGFLDYAFGSGSVGKNNSRSIYVSCLELRQVFQVYDIEYKERWEENEIPSIKQRIRDSTYDTKQFISELILLTGEKLNSKDKTQLEKCVIEMRKAEVKKQLLIDYQHADEDCSETNSDALDELSELWRALMNGSTTPEISNTAAPSGSNYTEDRNRWPYLGFQSSNPFRDFRDTGRLGLRMLKLWAVSNPRLAREMLDKSHTGAYYPLCCVGLNVTSWMVEHLKNGDLDSLFLMNENDEFEILSSVWCYTLLEFHRAWICARPDSLLQFSVVRDQFRGHLLELLNHISLTGINSGCGVYKMSLLPQGVLYGSDVQKEFELWVRGDFDSRPDSPKIRSAQLRLGANTKPLTDKV